MYDQCEMSMDYRMLVNVSRAGYQQAGLVNYHQDFVQRTRGDGSRLVLDAWTREAFFCDTMAYPTPFVPMFA